MSETYIKINNKNKRRKIIYSDGLIKGHEKKGGLFIVSKALVPKGVTNPKPALSIKRGDTVMVISGADKGKTGKIIACFPRKGRIIIEGVNMIKRHQKPKGVGRAGEIINKEAPIFASKVMYYDLTKKKPTRIGHKILKDGKKVRISTLSGEQID